MLYDALTAPAKEQPSDAAPQTVRQKKPWSNPAQYILPHTVKRTEPLPTRKRLLDPTSSLAKSHPSSTSEPPPSLAVPPQAIYDHQKITPGAFSRASAYDPMYPNEYITAKEALRQAAKQARALADPLFYDQYARVESPPRERYTPPEPPRSDIAHIESGEEAYLRRRAMAGARDT